MKIVILSGSPRPNGNSATLAEAFRAAAVEAGHEVTLFPVGNMDISDCKACEYCHTKGEGQCIQKDDMEKINPAIHEADMVVIASSIFYWAITAKLQSCINRLYPLGKPQKATKFAFILSSGSNNVHQGVEAQWARILNYWNAENLGFFKHTQESGNFEEIKEQVVALAKSL